MAQQTHGVHLSVRVRPALAERLDRLATTAGLSRSTFLRLILERVDERTIPPGLADIGAEPAAARTVRP